MSYGQNPQGNAHQGRRSGRERRSRGAAPKRAGAERGRAARCDPRGRARRILRPGVAKGTIYLYFADKEALFEELVRFQLYPVIGSFEAALKSDLPLRALVDQAIEIFSHQVFGTRRALIMRLIMSEGPRFPALAEFYYREVLSRILGAVRARLVRAFERGEIADETLIRFPQLLGAATVVAVVWQGLFDRFEPLDAPAMLRAYFDRLFPRDGRPA
jgi:AcrR family transcriptional regulator